MDPRIPRLVHGGNRIDAANRSPHRQSGSTKLLRHAGSLSLGRRPRSGWHEKRETSTVRLRAVSQLRRQG
jgi:hypothetical protein